MKIIRLALRWRRPIAVVLYLGLAWAANILAFDPKTLLLFERHENSLFAISNES